MKIKGTLKIDNILIGDIKTNWNCNFPIEVEYICDADLNDILNCKDKQCDKCLHGTFSKVTLHEVI